MQCCGHQICQFDKLAHVTMHTNVPQLTNVGQLHILSFVFLVVSGIFYGFEVRGVTKPLLNRLGHPTVHEMCERMNVAKHHQFLPPFDFILGEKGQAQSPQINTKLPPHYHIIRGFDRSYCLMCSIMQEMGAVIPYSLTISRLVS